MPRSALFTLTIPFIRISLRFFWLFHSDLGCFWLGKIEHRKSLWIWNFYEHFRLVLRPFLDHIQADFMALIVQFLFKSFLDTLLAQFWELSWRISAKLMKWMQIINGFSIEWENSGRGFCSRWLLSFVGTFAELHFWHLDLGCSRV